MKKILLTAVAAVSMLFVGIIGASAVSAAGWTPLRHGATYATTYRGVTAGACRVGASAPYKVKVLISRSDTTALRGNVWYQTFNGDPATVGSTAPQAAWGWGVAQIHEVNNMINGTVNAKVRFSDNELATWYMVQSGGWVLPPSSLQVCP